MVVPLDPVAGPPEIVETDKRVRQVIELTLDASASTSLTLQEFGVRLSVSPRHLGRLFYRSRGQTYAAFRRSVLLNRAAQALIKGAATEAAAHLAGYQDIRNFYRDFKCKFGVSPKALKITFAMQRL